MKDREHSSTIYTVDVSENGVFGDSGEARVTTGNKRDYWRNTLLPDVSFNPCIIVLAISLAYQRKSGIRVRALFVHKMSGPVLQMLGTRSDLFLSIYRY